MYDDSLGSITEGAALSSSILLVEHLALWEVRDRLHITARYVLGTSAIGAGVTWAALRQGNPLAAVTFWVIAGAGGALVVSAHWLRAMQEQPADELWRRALGGNNDAVRRTPPRHDR